MDVVVCNISTDAAFSGDYVKRDGTDVKRGELPRPKPGEPFAFTLDRFARITRTIDDGDAVLATSPEAVLDAKRQGNLALLAALEGGDGLEARVENLRDLYRQIRLRSISVFRYLLPRMPSPTSTAWIVGSATSTSSRASSRFPNFSARIEYPMFSGETTAEARSSRDAREVIGTPRRASLKTSPDRLAGVARCLPEIREGPIRNCCRMRCSSERIHMPD
jgi:hypothetical protein